MTCGSGRPNCRAKSRNSLGPRRCARMTRSWAAKNASQISRNGRAMLSISAPKLPSFLMSIKKGQRNFSVTSPGRLRRPFSGFELRYIEPFLLPPAFEPELGELHALRALEQVPPESASTGDVLEKELPLHFERIVVIALRHFPPIFVEVDRLGYIGIPDRLGRLRVRLGEAAPKPGYRTALGAVHLDGKQVIAANAHIPG